MGNNKRNRRDQTPKGGANKALTRAMQGKRFSSAAGPHPRAVDFRRKPKYPQRYDMD